MNVSSASTIVTKMQYVLITLPRLSALVRAALRVMELHAHGIEVRFLLGISKADDHKSSI